MKVELEGGEVLSAEWVEVWHENGTILIGTGDDLKTCELNELSKIEKE